MLTTCRVSTRHRAAYDLVLSTGTRAYFFLCRFSYLTVSTGLRISTSAKTLLRVMTLSMSIAEIFDASCMQRVYYVIDKDRWQVNYQK